MDEKIRIQNTLSVLASALQSANPNCQEVMDLLVAIELVELSTIGKMYQALDAAETGYRLFTDRLSEHAAHVNAMARMTSGSLPMGRN